MFNETDVNQDMAHTHTGDGPKINKGSVNQTGNAGFLACSVKWFIAALDVFYSFLKEETGGHFFIIQAFQQSCISLIRPVLAPVWNENSRTWQQSVQKIEKVLAPPHFLEKCLSRNVQTVQR